MPKDTHKKIAIVTISLAGGGAERSAGLLSQMLTDLGHSVHVVTLQDKVTYPYAGTLFNLGAEKTEIDSPQTKWKHLKRLRSYFKRHNFDLIIDNRSRPSFLKELIYTRFIYRGFKVLGLVHSARLETYFPKPFVLSKVGYRDFHFVAVSKRISEKVKKQLGFDVPTIYNAIPQFTSVQSSQVLPDLFILGYGRLEDEVKNFSLMISAFAKANLKLPLLIMGEGPDKEKLSNLAKNLGVGDKVHFIGHKEHPEAIVKMALFTILTSHYEGFPMVLVESLALGTPVLSVDCESGPKEIVKNGHNGLLVSNYDEATLAKAIRTLVLDGELLAYCASNAQESVAHLQQEHIAKNWQQLIDSL